MQPKKTPRISIPPAIRSYVLDRDNHTCQICGSTENLVIDHIIPLAKGGTNDISNFQTLCLSCNSRKGSRITPETQRHFSSNTNDPATLPIAPPTP
jgi:5-methylcytosine-specific restriction enzyme A